MRTKSITVVVMLMELSSNCFSLALIGSIIYVYYVYMTYYLLMFHTRFYTKRKVK